MSGQRASSQVWLDALVASAFEASSTALGWESNEVVERCAELPAGTAGAYLPLVADQSLQIALVSDEAGCQRMAKALLGMDAGDEDLPPGAPAGTRD